jgi:hypothetical protein
MSQFSEAARSVISTVAPLLGTALGGPLGGLAGGLISKALGGTSAAADPKALEKLILGQDPQTLIALKQAEAELQVHMRELDISEEKLAIDDRASARQREAAVHDWMPGTLGMTITLGFFSVLVYMMMHHIPQEDRDTLNIMLGSLGTAWIAVVSYYFGSSAGSRAKDTTIDKLSK